MPTIFTGTPNVLQNGTTADATQVMADFTQIISDGNANAMAKMSVPPVAGNLIKAADTSGQLVSDAGLVAIQVGDGRFISSQSGGSANAYTATFPLPPAALFNGQRLWVQITASNTGASTLNVNGLGAIAIKKQNASGLTALVGGELINGSWYAFIYDGVQWQLIGQTIAAGTGLAFSGSALGIANGGVHQAQLNVSTGTVSLAQPASVTANGANFALPGGAYGFYPQTYLSAGRVTSTFNAGIVHSPFTAQTIPVAVNWINGSDPNTNTPTATIFLVIYPGASDTGISVSANQTFINASPPYDLGDGEVAGFVYMLVQRSDLRVVCSYLAPVPPWAYNGPRQTEQLDNMGLIPHPFLSIDESKYAVCLLDPMNAKLIDFLKDHNTTIDGLHNGIIKFDPTPLNRKGPPGVIHVRML